MVFQVFKYYSGFSYRILQHTSNFIYFKQIVGVSKWYHYFVKN